MRAKVGVQLKSRVIGEYKGSQPGPLIVGLAGVHGNELAGIFGLQSVFDFLNNHQPGFVGTFVGLAGNLKAIQNRDRFIDKDLNRQWHSDHIARLKETPIEALTSNEDREQKELYACIEKYLDTPHTSVLFIDFHTTSAFGGVFSIANNVKKSLHFAANLNVPVITGLHDVLHGTTLNFLEELGIPGVGFEAGQHQAPSSIDNIIGAMLMTLVGAGCIHTEDIAQFQYYHTHLYQYGIGLPKFVEFVYRHPVTGDEEFQMRHGYENFQPVVKNELIAKDKTGDIFSPENGMILMPLYQSQGDDGFFIIREINRKTLEQKEFQKQSRGQ